MGCRDDCARKAHIDKLDQLPTASHFRCWIMGGFKNVDSLLQRLTRVKRIEGKSLNKDLLLVVTESTREGRQAGRFRKQPH